MLSTLFHDYFYQSEMNLVMEITYASLSIFSTKHRYKDCPRWKSCVWNSQNEKGLAKVRISLGMKSEMNIRYLQSSVSLALDKNWFVDCSCSSEKFTSNFNFKPDSSWMKKFCLLGSSWFTRNVFPKRDPFGALSFCSKSNVLSSLCFWKKTSNSNLKWSTSHDWS